MKNNRKLKNYLIYPEFQIKFILILVFTNIFIAGLIILFSYYYFINSTTLYGVLEYIHSDSSTTFKEELGQYLFILGILLIVFLGMISLAALVLSHRAAGPIYKFKKVFDAIAAGEKEYQVLLRPKDNFKDVADSFNNMIDKLTKK